jgi:hypothetical protein
MLKGVEAIIQRQERVPTERNHHRFLGLAENGRARIRRAGLAIFDRLALAPLRDRLRVDGELPPQRRGRSF